MKKIVEIAHDLLSNSNYQKAIDFTCGQGFDTLFLCEQGYDVIGFDIQNEAINQTKDLLCQHQQTAILYQCSHDQIEGKIQSFDCAIYNLGYLPHGDPSITTTSSVVVSSLQKVLPLLNSSGRIAIVCYPGFEAGLSEANAIEAYAMTLPSKHYDVSMFKLLNRQLCPYIILIEKH